jgi:hypothetical protein
MKLPRMVATVPGALDVPHRTTYVAGGRGQIVSSQANVKPMLDFGCLLGCGVKALPCITCGTDIACWLECAGPSTVRCVTGCL